MSQDNEDTSSDESSVSLSDEESKVIKLKDKKERIFIEFMTHSNEYVKLRHQMNVHLARGHLNMARATRSNLNRSKFNRNKNIFNKEMSAISTVTTDKKETFTLHRNKAKSEDDDGLVDPLDDDDGPNLFALHKRTLRIVYHLWWRWQMLNRNSMH
eukprot:690033_1